MPREPEVSSTSYILSSIDSILVVIIIAKATKSKGCPTRSQNLLFPGVETGPLSKSCQAVEGAIMRKTP